MFGWTRALYSALTIFINGRVIDAVYTQHQKNAGNDCNATSATYYRRHSKSNAPWNYDST